MSSNMKLSRRNFLKGIGGSALALSLGANLWQVRSVSAQADSPMLVSTTAFYRFMVGELEVTVVQDATVPLDAGIFAVNADAADLEAVLSNNNLSTGAQIATVNVMVVRGGDYLALIDTGTGGTFGVPPRLVPTLGLLGISPENVTHVLISHFHGDHVAGVSDDNGLAFPNASVHISQVEWDFLQAPPPAPAADMVNAALAKLQPAVDADRLQFYSDGQEVLSGIQAVAAFGHTPGHHAFLLNSGGSSLLNMIDTANHHVIALHNPDWVFGFDAIPELASATRRSVLQRAADEKQLVFGYHFPFPGVGVIDTDGEGFRFIPVGV